MNLIADAEGGGQHLGSLLQWALIGGGFMGRNVMGVVRRWRETVEVIEFCDTEQQVVRYRVRKGWRDDGAYWHTFYRRSPDFLPVVHRRLFFGRDGSTVERFDARLGGARAETHLLVGRFDKVYPRCTLLREEQVPPDAILVVKILPPLANTPSGDSAG